MPGRGEMKNENFDIRLLIKVRGYPTAKDGRYWVRCPICGGWVSSEDVGIKPIIITNMQAQCGHFAGWDLDASGNIVLDFILDFIKEV
jgi:hypothetical protein